MFDLILNVTDGVKKQSFKSHLDSEFREVCHFHKYFLLIFFSHLLAICPVEIVDRKPLNLLSFLSHESHGLLLLLMLLLTLSSHKSLRKMTGRRLKVEMAILSFW